MVYVSYVRHVNAHERQRTPAGKLAAWFYSRAAGTFLQDLLSFLFFKSFLARLATAITLGVLLGFIIDFSISFLPDRVLSFLVTGAILGLIAGVGSQGFGGGVIGCLWAWLVANLTDTVASESVSDSANRIPVKVIGWLLTCIVGWVAGLIAGWMFERFTFRYAKARRLILSFLILVVLASVGICFYRTFKWATTAHPLISMSRHLINMSRHWVALHWRGIVVVTLWIGCPVVPAIRLLADAVHPPVDHPPMRWYWFKCSYFFLVTLTIGLAATNGIPNEALRRIVPPSAGPMCMTCLVLAIISRFADAGSMCIALSKRGLVEGAPGWGHAPSRRTLYRFTLGQSIVLAVATAGIGSFYPLVAIIGLLVISCASGMATLNNQVLYWLAPPLPSRWLLPAEREQQRIAEEREREERQRSKNERERLISRLPPEYQEKLRVGEEWERDQREREERQREMPWSMERYSYQPPFYVPPPVDLGVYFYEMLSIPIQILALIIPPAIIVLFAGTIMGAGGGGLIPNWAILPIPREWVIGTALIWTTYVCFGGLRWVERLPRQLIVGALRSTRW